MVRAIRVLLGYVFEKLVDVGDVDVNDVVVNANPKGISATHV